ncbi:GDSL-type esterase/lipase family protein [Sporolactobacillus sp. STCC-11]|uniref:GDSL-type esterase/lipase family protein n=1 Tax=Sporolactobacillus caesalpiniae TaxID=3230362 RepID=UPI0033922B83
MKKLKNILVLSLMLNLILVLFGSVYIIKKNVTPVAQGTPFHAIKKSEFSILPANKNDIVFAGDSLTNYCNWSELFGNSNIKNRGIPGDKTDGVIDNIANIVKGQPKKIFLMVGINDLSNGVSVKSTLANYKKVINSIKQKSPSSKLIVQSVLPINTDILKDTKASNSEIKKLNIGLKLLAKDYGLQYVDLSYKFIDKNEQLKRGLTIDGIHLNGDGYLLWKKTINDYVN